MRPAISTFAPAGRPTSSHGLPDEAVVEDLRRTESIAQLVRWIGVVFAALQVTIFSSMPYPEGVQGFGYVLSVVLAIGNAALWLANRRIDTAKAARRLGILALAFDVAVAVGFVWLYTFDATSTLYTILFILPIDGALRFQLKGALAAWAAATTLYVFRELFGRDVYGHTFQIDSITFRMGMLLLVTTMVGMMARNLWEQRVSLQAALEKLRWIDTWRSGLVSVLAHDVRGPLSTVQGALDILDRRAETLTPERTSELLAMARRQTRRTVSLAEDLLDLARLEQGRLVLQPQPILVRDVVEEALESLPTTAGVEVQVPDDLLASVDPGRLRQIVVNLVGNGLKYGKPPVTISGEAPQGQLRLVIEDRGAGVPAEDRDTLFEPFVRGARADSVGLGLWVVSQLARAHGGTVTYDDSWTEGARFVVVLEQRDAHAAEETDALLPPDLEPPRRKAAARRATKADDLR